MSRATSATTGRRYGLKRVCGTWERSRSALYARRARLQRPERGDGPARRGPTPALSDAQLLAAIRSDLARSPFQGEGHRKVHARLRVLDRVRVSRTRVLRVMRSRMWGTDGVRVFTADDGWVWTFAAVDHWNAECVGWHVCKVGSRSRAARLGDSTARWRTWPAGLLAGSRARSEERTGPREHAGAPSWMPPSATLASCRWRLRRVRRAGSARTEGARRATGVGADGAAGAGGCRELLRGESLGVPAVWSSIAGAWSVASL